jgi:hypothetical protein
LAGPALPASRSAKMRSRSSGARLSKPVPFWLRAPVGGVDEVNDPAAAASDRVPGDHQDFRASPAASALGERLVLAKERGEQRREQDHVEGAQRPQDRPLHVASSLLMTFKRFVFLG